MAEEGGCSELSRFAGARRVPPPCSQQEKKDRAGRRAGGPKQAGEAEAEGVKAGACPRESLPVVLGKLTFLLLLAKSTTR